MPAHVLREREREREAFYIHAIGFPMGLANLSWQRVPTEALECSLDFTFEGHHRASSWPVSITLLLHGAICPTLLVWPAQLASCQLA